VSAPRVLIVSHTYAAPINRAKLDALARLVMLTAVVPARWRDALFSLQTQTSEPTRYALHPLPIRFDGHILRYFYPFKQLSHIVQQARPDLVYVEEEPASLALAQLAFLKRRYGYRLVFFTWENILRRAGLLGLEGHNLRHCDGAIAGNREAADVIRHKGFRNPICVTPQLGIDPARFQPARATELRRSLGLAGFVVGFFGRLVEEKGVRVLIDAVRDLDGTRLLIVGDGPLRAEIERSAPQARLTGAMPHHQAIELLAAIDLLVLPSLTTPTWKEQFGHVLIEAMACAAPVIGSNSGAIPEVIGDAGLIFPEGDAAALREAIVSLQVNPTRRAELGQAGRTRVLAHFTHDRIAAANVDFFEQVLRT
jgi:glycosyltransferase involved in cell wall biosynthesis